MSRVLILGAGISGHTAAAYLRRWLNRSHEVIVVAPTQYYQWIPSNIWVGSGRMNMEQVRFKLAPLYKKWGIVFKQAKAISIHPEGNSGQISPFVSIEYTDNDNAGRTENIEYDFLINATGPRLNFEATEGLGPGRNSVSVCTCSHASEAWDKLKECIERMKNGKRQRFLIGAGHATSTCQGAAFEYILNVENEIRQRGLRDMADITWISNEYEIGDFGMGGAFIKRGGYVTSTKIFAESFFTERGIRWIKRAGIYKVEPEKVLYETLEGEYLEEPFDFAMLIPSFSGHGIKAFGKTDADITAKVFVPGGFMKVDADYSGKPYEEWTVEDWPSTYRNPDYPNIFAVGIAFATPHAISMPIKSKNGTSIFPTAPRTGMPSGVIGKVVAQNIAEWINQGKQSMEHRASMGKMGAACIISAGFSLTHGTAATITVAPIVPDWVKFPKWGRDIKYTIGEPGLAGHWLKLFMHYLFLYKAKGRPFWYLLPE